MHLGFQPQHSIPDVFVWMIVDKKRIAYYRIPAKELMHASQAELIGKHCGKLQTIFLRVSRDGDAVFMISQFLGVPLKWSVKCFVPLHCRSLGGKEQVPLGGWCRRSCPCTCGWGYETQNARPVTS